MEAITDDDIVITYGDDGGGNYHQHGYGGQRQLHQQRVFGDGSSNNNGNYGYNQYNYQGQHQQSSSPISMLFQSMIWLLDKMTGGPNSIGVAIAFIVIVIFQFRPQITDFFYNAMEDGLWQTSLEVLLGFHDLIRAYYQITLELLRSFGIIRGDPDNTNNQGRYAPRQFLGRVTRSNNAGTPPPLVTFNGEDEIVEEIEENVRTTTSNNNTKKKKKRKKKNNNTAKSLARGGLNNDNHVEGMMDHHSTTEFLMNGNGSTYTNRNGTSCSSEPSSPVSHCPQHQGTDEIADEDDEIEPAFLNAEDYPPGWLVYHPVLGVVPKEEADDYDNKTERMCEESNQQEPTSQQNETNGTAQPITTTTTTTDLQQQHTATATRISSSSSAAASTSAPAATTRNHGNGSSSSASNNVTILPPSIAAGG